ncbi:hypothetical protein Hanom_Chr09g00801391 [Helianthus anomalus]
MGYEGIYPTVLKKLFPSYWRLLCTSSYKTQTCAIVALVNIWDFNFSAFIFDNMKKMLEDPKKKICMLYPRFLQMILDYRHPELVKGPNYINLKPMGPSCFKNACRNKRAKHHNFEGKFSLEKHGRFTDIVQRAPVAPVPPVPPVAPVPPPINAQIVEEHDVQLMQQVQQVAGNENEIEVEVVDLESETGSSEEETDSASEVEIVMVVIKNPPSVSTAGVQDVAATSQVETEIKAITDDAEESTRKKQRTDSTPDDVLSGPSTAPDSSGGVRFEAGSYSGAGVTKHDEAAFIYATEKRQIFESDGDSDEDAYVQRLKRSVVVLEQDAELKNAQITSLQHDAALKEAQISSLQSQLTSSDLTVDQLQGDLGMLMSTVYCLKEKLEKKFGSEFADKEDEQFYIGRTEQTPEQRRAAHATAEAERAAA